jgi:hypothetical protein
MPCPITGEEAAVGGDPVPLRIGGDRSAHSFEWFMPMRKVLGVGEGTGADGLSQVESSGDYVERLGRLYPVAIGD